MKRPDELRHIAADGGDKDEIKDTPETSSEAVGSSEEGTKEKE